MNLQYIMKRIVDTVALCLQFLLLLSRTRAEHAESVDFLKHSYDILCIQCFSVLK